MTWSSLFTPSKYNSFAESSVDLERHNMSDVLFERHEIVKKTPWFRGRINRDNISNLMDLKPHFKEKLCEEPNIADDAL